MGLEWSFQETPSTPTNLVLINVSDKTVSCPEDVTGVTKLDLNLGWGLNGTRQVSVINTRCS